MTTCTLYNAQQELQHLTIDLSRDQPISILDSFGSFQVESCNGFDCSEELTYTYTIFNSGSVIATITSLQRIWSSNDGDNTEDLLNVLEDQELTPAGGIVTIEESEIINLCQDQEYLTKVQVIAESPLGDICPAEGDYFFETTVACQVDVDIMCMTRDGVDCSAIQSPPGMCSLEEDITVLRFRFLPDSCDETAPTHTQTEVTCEDFGNIPKDGTVALSCVSDDAGRTPLQLSQAEVITGDSFEMTTSDGSPLPASVLCNINSHQSGGATVFQQFTFFTSNGVDGNDLSLKDRFGSFELEACSNDAGESYDCIQTIQYTYAFQNIGTNDMNITQLQRMINNSTQDFHGSLNDFTLSPGEGVEVMEEDHIDICLQQEYRTEMFAEANSPSGMTCVGQDTYEFGVNPPCDLAVSTFYLPCNLLFMTTNLYPMSQCGSHSCSLSCYLIITG